MLKPNVLFTATFFSYLSLCYGSELPMMTIVHPEILSVYYDLVSKLPQRWSLPFGHLSNTGMPTNEELCIALAEATVFTHQVSEIPQIDHNRIGSFYARTKKQKVDESSAEQSDVIRSLHMWSNRAGKYFYFDAIPCFIENGGQAWYIADIFNSGTYYAISKKPDQEPIRLDGLLEPIPQVSDELSNNQEELEKAFLGQKTSGDVAKHNVKELNHFDIFRICSGIAVVWSKKKNIVLPEVNYIWPADGSNQSHILMDVAIHLESLPVFIESNPIACYLNEDSVNPQFYIATDMETIGGVYVIEKNREDIYSVFMHVKEVMALKQKVFQITDVNINVPVVSFLCRMLNYFLL